MDCKKRSRRFQVSEKKFPNYPSMSYLQWTCKEWFFAKIVQLWAKDLQLLNLTNPLATILTIFTTPLPLSPRVIENLSFLRARNSWQFSKKLLYIELVANPQENTVIIANFSNSGKYLFVTDTTLLDFMISTIF